MVDLEWLLMKDFLFDPRQAFCHAISTTPWELFLLIAGKGEAEMLLTRIFFLSDWDQIQQK